MPCVLAGVVGGDDVGMVSWRRPPPRAGTARWRRWFFIVAAGSTLRATRRFIRRCWALNTDAHAAGAELVEHDVLAEDQVLVLALSRSAEAWYLVSLPWRISSLARASPSAGPLLGGRPLANRGHLGRRHQAGLAEVVDELLQRERHRPAQSVTP